MREDIQTGTRFPDYELPDHTDKRRKLSALQGDNPMVFVLFRGDFCPKDQNFLKNPGSFQYPLFCGVHKPGDPHHR